MIRDREYNSQPFHCHVIPLGKLFTPACFSHQAVYNLVLANGRWRCMAGKVALAWRKVIGLWLCMLWPGSALAAAVISRMRRLPLSLPLVSFSRCWWHRCPYSHHFTSISVMYFLLLCTVMSSSVIKMCKIIGYWLKVNECNVQICLSDLQSVPITFAFHICQRSVTPCGWQLKAGMVCVWVTGKTMWSPCYTGSYLSALEIHLGHCKALCKFTFFTFYFIHSLAMYACVWLRAVETKIVSIWSVQEYFH